MSSNTQPGPYAHLVEQLHSGQITRRSFLAAGAALGISTGMLGMAVRHAQSVGAAPHPQDATPAATDPQFPTAGGEGKTRGQDGELKILIWQAPTGLNPHTAVGDKDSAASSLVCEALMSYTPEEVLVPRLITQVPTMENGDLGPDFKSVTFRLLPGVLWSDGTPFTARDVVFTHSWVTDPANNALTLEAFSTIQTIEAVDDVTVQVTFAAPTLNWYVPFAGISSSVLPEHYVTSGGDMVTAPIGTGPYVVRNFATNDQILFDANPNYRNPNQPYFASVNMKGGGDSATTAQSVIQTGDWDFAWNVAVEPEVVASYESDDSPGVFRVQPGSSVERININFSDPRMEGPDGQMSWYQNPHPILSDPAVRQAMATAIDRQLLVDQFYDPRGERTTSNFLTGIPAVESPNTSWSYDPDAANQLLEDAGWVKSGDFREKNGTRLQLNLSTTVNSVRQKVQLVVQQNWKAIGIDLQLEQVDGAIFFDSAPGNTQNSRHMYVDMNMFTSGPESPTPINYMMRFYAGPEASNIAQQSNNWSGANFIRYVQPEFDAIMDEILAGSVATVEDLNQKLIQLNDIVIRDNAVIPLVNTGAKYAVHATLVHGDRATGEDNVFSSRSIGNFQNIAAWNRSTPLSR